MEDRSTNIRAAAAKLLSVSLSALPKIFQPHRRRVLEGRLSERRFWHKITRQLGSPSINNPPISQLIELYRPNPHARRLSAFRVAKKLRRNGYRTGIISDVTPTQARLVQRRGIYRGFRPVILSCKSGATKRSSRPFRLAARRSGVRFSEMVFFDDRAPHVAIAKKLGIKAFVYKNPSQLVRQLRRFGVKI